MTTRGDTACNLWKILQSKIFALVIIREYWMVLQIKASHYNISYYF